MLHKRVEFSHSRLSILAEKVTSLGKDWHRPCLRCERCGKTLTPGGHAEVSHQWAWTGLGWQTFCSIGAKRDELWSGLGFGLILSPMSSGATSPQGDFSPPFWSKYAFLWKAPLPPPCSGYSWNTLNGANQSLFSATDALIVPALHYVSCLIHFGHGHIKSIAQDACFFVFFTQTTSV